MPESSKVLINEIDLAHAVQSPPKGIMGVLGTTVRGLINNPKKLIKSWPEFVKNFGGLSTSSDFPLLCRRALERGAILRVCRIVHYNDIAIATPAATLATIKPTSSLSFDATALKTGDSIVATINGSALPAVPFTISHTYTMGLIAAMIKTSPLVQDAVVIKNPTPGANPRNIVVGYKTAAAAIVTFTVVVTGAPTVTVVTHTLLSTVVNSAAATLINITPIAQGANYNNLLLYTSPPSNKKAGYFDLYVTVIGEPDATEAYKNLQVLPVLNATLQTGLLPLGNSDLVAFTCPDLTAATDLSPLSGIYAYQTGTDGGAIVSNDYIGSEITSTGYQAFNTYGDVIAMATPEVGITDIPVTQAGVAYANNRKDLVYLAHIPNSLTSEGAINTAIDACLVDSSYMGFYGGGLNVLDPTTGAEKTISEVGDILGLIAYTHANFGTNYSFAGKNRGVIPNTTGPVTNFGSPGKKADLEFLAANRANMVINAFNKVYLKGNFTGQVVLSPLSFMSIRLLLIDIKKSLAPTLENYLEEPCEPITWLRLYQEVKPYLKSLSDKRALQGQEGIGWDWQGDQYVTNLANLLINNANDVSLGKYKVKLFVKPVNSIQIIELSIVITPGGISFEEAIALL